MTRWPVALFYNMLDVSAVNAYVVWQQLQGENSSCFSKKEEKKVFDSAGKRASWNVTDICKSYCSATKQKEES